MIKMVREPVLSMDHKNEIFPSKIILLGEYTIINGSKGLIIPFEKYYATYDRLDNAHSVEESFRLDALYHYMTSSQILSDSMDLDRFYKDIQNGFYLNSDIPIGYGVGSSGALCAAIYARYSYDFKRQDQYTHEELSHFKDSMALMENFYHGTSSGLDCLITLLNKPLLVQRRNQCDIIDMPDLNAVGAFFLYDTGIKRKTGPFVHKFLQKYETDPAYKSTIDDHSKLVEGMIDNLIQSQSTAFQANMKTLSHFQFEHFQDMIPESVKPVWKQGLDTDEYYFKLCGAGGGGYFLIYTKDGYFDPSDRYIKINQ